MVLRTEEMIIIIKLFIKCLSCAWQWKKVTYQYLKYFFLQIWQDRFHQKGNSDWEMSWFAPDLLQEPIIKSKSYKHLQHAQKKEEQSI